MNLSRFRPLETGRKGVCLLEEKNPEKSKVKREANHPDSDGRYLADIDVVLDLIPPLAQLAGRVRNSNFLLLQESKLDRFALSFHSVLVNRESE